MGKKVLDNKFEWYNPDMELEVTGKRKSPGNEDYGHKLADIIMESNKSKEIFNVGGEEKPSLKRILKYTPKNIRVCGIPKSKLDGELNRLRKAGYDIGTEQNLERLPKEKKWNLYVKTLKNNGYFKKN
jgi:hypothetical protein